MYLNYEQLEQIAEAAIQDFNNFFYGDTEEAREPHATPIDQFARDYLNLDVKIERLCSDESICGITAYSDTELETSINGYRVCLPVKQNEVLLDINFLQPGNVQRLCGKRRFTLAHECAHQLLYQIESDENKTACRRMYRDKKSYTAKELKTREDWNEWQANVVGAAIILPRRDVSALAKSILKDKKIIVVFDRCTQYEADVIRYIADTFHASPTAVKIRLERLGFLEDHSPRYLYEDHKEAMAI